MMFYDPTKCNGYPCELVGEPPRPPSAAAPVCCELYVGPAAQREETRAKSIGRGEEVPMFAEPTPKYGAVST